MRLWGPLSQIKVFKQGHLISNKGFQTGNGIQGRSKTLRGSKQGHKKGHKKGITLLKLGFQTRGPPLLRSKTYFKLNELFSNAKYEYI